MFMRPALMLGSSAIALAAFIPGTGAQAARGRIACTVLDNGAPASGTMTARLGSRQHAQGPCGAPLDVPAGSYHVEVQLDGALDSPTEVRTAHVRAGQTSQVEVGFATGTLRVMVQAAGRRAAAMAVIYRNGRRVGTLGSGVSAHLSAGRYEVEVRHRTEQRRFDDIVVRRAERRTLEVAFP
jgi:hypothetical protein